MSNFLLSTDKCCDELASELKARQIEYIPIAYICEEKIVYDNFTSDDEYVNFYNNTLANNKVTTSGLNFGEVEEYFVNLLKKYNTDIVHICLSSGLSGTYSTVCMVAEELNKTNANHIYVIDSKSATVGEGLLVLKAEKLRDQGLSAKETSEQLENFVKHISASFYVPDLNTLKRGGRISGVAFVVAKLIQMKPYLEIDANGELKVVQKIIGAGNKKAISVMAERLKNTIDETEDLPVIIVKTTDDKAAEDLKAEVQKYTTKPIIIRHMGPVISAHTGQGTLGIVYAQKDEK